MLEKVIHCSVHIIDDDDDDDDDTFYRGKSSSRAEFSFLEQASWLDHYGVEMHEVKVTFRWTFQWTLMTVLWWNCRSYSIIYLVLPFPV